MSENDARKDVDEELVNKFLYSRYPKKWRIWKLEDSKERPLDSVTSSALCPRLPEIPEIEVSGLNFFKRDNTVMTISTICLPALELRFQDPERPGVTYIGFIEGRENLNNFLREFAERYNKQYPFYSIEGIIERAGQLFQ